jgi:GNAT superfamily N-acetyltransferase
MAQPLHIRTYESADRAGADRVLSESFGRPFLPALVRCEQLATAHLFVGLIDETIVATAVTQDYGTVGYIGMVAVSPAWRGRGFARRITERALEAVPPGATTLLDASPEGAPIYERLGFEDAGSAVVLKVRASPLSAAADGIEPLAPGDLGELQAFDRALFGADRSKVLVFLAAELSGRCVVARRGGRLAGFAFAQNHAIGPCLAADGAVAAGLLSRARALCPAAAPTLTVPGDNAAALSLAAELGFTEDRRLRHMRRGPDPTRRQHLFAYANFHFG